MPDYPAPETMDNVEIVSEINELELDPAVYVWLRYVALQEELRARNAALEEG